jgi:hypothetical protein
MNQSALPSLVRRNIRKHELLINPSIKRSLITFILLVLFLATNQASGQITQSFYHTQTQRGMLKSFTGYSAQSTLYVGNVSFDQTGRGYIVFNIATIPSNATVTAATLNLKPTESTGTTFSTTSTILFKNLTNRPANFNTAADFTFLNGVSQFASINATVNSPLVISTAALKTKVQSSLGEGFLYFGLVNSGETSKGLSFSTTNADLFLSVTYIIPVPAAPTNLQASNITTTGCTLTWSKPAGTLTGYKIYKNDVFQQSVTTLSTTIQNLSPNTNYSFKVSAYNAGGESPKSTPVSITTLAAPVAPVGATFNNPIDFGNIGLCSSYGHNADVTPGNGYGNEYGNQFVDIFYKFNLTVSSNVSLSNCKSDGVSGLIYLLDASGNSVPGGTEGQTCDVGFEIIYNLQPGVYYVVTEPMADYTTGLPLQIYVPGPSCRMAGLQITGSPNQVAATTSLEETNIPQFEGAEVHINNIYPNPASHHVFLNLQQDGPATIHIVNKDGIKVKETILAEKFEGLNVSDLPTGLYLVKIIQRNKVRSEKMLIER